MHLLSVILLAPCLPVLSSPMGNGDVSGRAPESHDLATPGDFTRSSLSETNQGNPAVRIAPDSVGFIGRNLRVSELIIAEDPHMSEFVNKVEAMDSNSNRDAWEEKMKNLKKGLVDDMIKKGYDFILPSGPEVLGETVSNEISNIIVIPFLNHIFGLRRQQASQDTKDKLFTSVGENLVAYILNRGLGRIVNDVMSQHEGFSNEIGPLPTPPIQDKIRAALVDSMMKQEVVYGPALAVNRGVLENVFKEITPQVSQERDDRTSLDEKILNAITGKGQDGPILTYIKTNKDDEFKFELGNIVHDVLEEVYNLKPVSSSARWFAHSISTKDGKEVALLGYSQRHERMVMSFAEGTQPSEIATLVDSFSRKAKLSPLLENRVLGNWRHDYENKGRRDALEAQFKSTFESNDVSNLIEEFIEQVKNIRKRIIEIVNSLHGSGKRIPPEEKETIYEEARSNLEQSYFALLPKPKFQHLRTIYILLPSEPRDLEKAAKNYGLDAKELYEDKEQPRSKPLTLAPQFKDAIGSLAPQFERDLKVSVIQFGSKSQLALELSY